MISEMREIFRDAYHQWYVQTALVSVPLAARQHAAMVAKVKDKCVLKQSVGSKLFHHVAELAVDGLNAVQIARVGVTKQRCIRMIGRELHFRRVMLCLFVFVNLLRKMERTLVRLSHGLHIKEGLPFRALTPTGVA